MKHMIGDILSPAGTERTVVLNPVGDNGKIVGGLHGDICKKFPFVGDLYQEFCRKIWSGAHKKGDIQIFGRVQQNFIIVNAAVFGIQPGVVYDIETTRRAIDALARNFPGYTIRIPHCFDYPKVMPKMVWISIKNLIESELVQAANINVEIWTHNAGMKPRALNLPAGLEV